MTQAIRLRLPLVPFGAARTRTRAFNTGRKDRRGQPIYSTQHFMDDAYREWRALAMPHFERAAPAHKLTGPLVFTLVAVHPFLKSDRRRTRHVPRRWHDVKPDFDNVSKAVLDCAEAAGWFHNDSQIARAVVEEVYAAQGEDPSLSIVVRELEPYGA